MHAHLIRSKKSLVWIFLLALAGMCCWLLEVVMVIGWNSLDWIDGLRFSPYAGIFAITSILCFLCYKAGEWLSHLTYCRLCPGDELAEVIGLGICLHVILAAAIWIMIKKWVNPVKIRALVRIVFLLLLIIPLSMMTVYLFPGFGHLKGRVDAVKMGYPVFYSISLMGISGLTLYTSS